VTPLEFQLLTDVWEREREHRQSQFAEVLATLYNTANGIGFKPPDGKHWKREMFMPGYQGPGPGDWDWRTQKQLMNLVGKKPDPVQRRADLEAQTDTRNRFEMAAEAKKRGATALEIRLILEA
jgi:hypothetical protein